MSGFVDLRLNRQEGQVNESFWPSFTDIMTVIMMIFLIAMVVLLMRNMELVNELRYTMESERLAAEQAARTGAANQSLSLKLTEAEARITRLQQQLDDAQQQHQRDQAVMTEQKREISTLMTERNDLAEQLALARIALDKQQQQMTRTQAQIAALQQQLDNLEARLANTMRQRDDLDNQLGQTRLALAEAERNQQADQQQYSELAGKYDALQLKYNKLVRPARSPKGHYLVELRYTKRDGAKRIAFRAGGEGDFQVLDRAAVNERLTDLKQAHKEGLYVKIIIPEDSGLSYNEAWSFTRNMLGLYDYYYEGQQDQLQPDR